MKFFAITLTIVLLTTTLTAQTPDLDSTTADNIAVYRVSSDAKDYLEQMQATVRHGRMDGDFIADLTPDQAEMLSSAGYSPINLFDSLQQEDLAFRSQPGFDVFHSYPQMRTSFDSLASVYPDIAEVHVLGTSVQGRDIFALRISNNIGLEEDEPEIGFWACIHGNEYGSAEMPFLYAFYLLTNYGSDPDVTAYVNNNEIWCLPVTNPDGRVNGTRNNANNVDLNRDLGYNWDGWGSSTAPFSQPETQVLRELCLANNFTLSIMYHCSGDEFYYPWGYFQRSAPDRTVLERLGERYADAANYDMMSSFQSYQTHGEVLDWAYGCFGQLSYTAEVSNSSAGVMTTFERNRPGMNIYCRLAGEGLHGTVTDAETGEPIEAAVWIQTSAIPCYTDAAAGDFHRLVLPGVYSVTAWANGYVPYIVNNVFVSFGAPGVVDFQLEPDYSEHAFMVTSLNQDDPNNSYSNRTYGAWALGESDNYPCSIGANGFIVLDMGEGHEITDGPGEDFTVVESILPFDSTAEGYRVYAGDAVTQNTLIGLGSGTESFDLAGTGITSTRYLKIIDQSGANPNEALPGMDLDCIIVLNSGEYIAGTEIEPEAVIPDEIVLSVYPNPFNQQTAISFQLSAAAKVELKIYDVLGRSVGAFRETPLQTWYPAGQHSVVWDAEGVASGVYFVRMDAGEFTKTQKLILMK